MLRPIFAFFASAFFLGSCFILFGLGVIWTGITMIRAARSPLRDSHAIPRRQFGANIWPGLGIMMGGLAFFLLGPITLRYAKGGHIVVPASAPLIDHIVWVLVFICGAGGFAMLYVGAWVNQLQNSRARREHTDEP